MFENPRGSCRSSPMRFFHHKRDARMGQPLDLIGFGRNSPMGNESLTRPVNQPWLRLFSRLPAGLVGMLVLIVGVETVVNSHRADLAPVWAEDWRFSSWAAKRIAPGSDVLCFGDSLVKYGVLPRVIEAKTGLKAYNLAVNGGPIPSAYFLLKQALDAGARPKAIVADFAALMLRDESQASLFNYPELATVADCVELAKVTGDADFLGSTLLAKLLPTFAWRFEIRQYLVTTLGGGDGSQRLAVAKFRQIWTKQRGAQPMHPGRIRHPREDFLIDGVSPSSWAIDPKNEVFLDRFLTLAEGRGIPVYWLIPPLCPEAHALRNQRGADETYARLVRSKLARFPNVVVLDARGSGYDNSVHIDHLHLDRVGATAFSEDVATIVEERLRSAQIAGGWVQLPNYWARPEALADRRGSTVQ